MDLRGQDKRLGMPSSLGFNPPIRDPSSTSIISSATAAAGGGGERRRDGTGNGTAMFTSFHQTLDHHHHHQQQPPENRQHSQERDPEPDPDPDHHVPAVPVSIAVTGSTTPTTTTRASTSTVRYQECLKNHAASIGGHVVDGCCEFMPGGEEGTPEALKCAACDCHRNFHRKEIDGENQSAANRLYYFRQHSNKIDTGRSRIPPPLPLLPPPPSAHHPSGSIPPMMMAFGGGTGGATDSSSDELNVFHSNTGAATAAAVAGQPPPPPFALSKKRFRTKFTQEQKEKMLEFAEKIGWRIQKQDEPAVQQFCAEVNVKRQVLKVWMHNNKHSMKKKEL